MLCYATVSYIIVYYSIVSHIILYYSIHQFARVGLRGAGPGRFWSQSSPWRCGCVKMR